MSGWPRTTVFVLTVILITLIVSSTIFLGYTLYWTLAYFLGYSLAINLSLEARLTGLILLATAVGVFIDVTRYRRLLDILVSTAETYTKLITRRPLGEKTGRTEPFIPKGPYSWVRNPMYLGAAMLAFGIGIVFSSTSLLLWGLVVTCWFWFVVIPLEERELEALFGEDYASYRRQVPKLFPYGKRYRPDEKNHI